MIQYKKTCEFCGRGYTAHRLHSKTCSSTCRVNYNKLKNKGFVRLFSVPSRAMLLSKGQIKEVQWHDRLMNDWRGKVDNNNVIEVINNDSDEDIVYVLKEKYEEYRLYFHESFRKTGSAGEQPAEQ